MTRLDNPSGCLHPRKRRKPCAPWLGEAASFIAAVFIAARRITTRATRS